MTSIVRYTKTGESPIDETDCKQNVVCKIMLISTRKTEINDVLRLCPNGSWIPEYGQNMRDFT